MDVGTNHFRQWRLHDPLSGGHRAKREAEDRAGDRLMVEILNPCVQRGRRDNLELRLLFCDCVEKSTLEERNERLALSVNFTLVIA